MCLAQVHSIITAMQQLAIKTRTPSSKSRMLTALVTTVDSHTFMRSSSQKCFYSIFNLYIIFDWTSKVFHHICKMQMTMKIAYAFILCHIICSRQLWIIFGQGLEKLAIWKCNHINWLKNIVANWDFAYFKQVPPLPHFYIQQLFQHCMTGFHS